MFRRQFLSSAALGAPMQIQVVPSFGPSSPKPALKIAGLEFLRLEGRREVSRGVNAQHQVNPLHIYEGYRPKPYKDAPQPSRGVRPVTALYLRIRTDGGLDGLYGPVDEEAALVADRQLKPLLAGKDPLAGEMLWDLMYRSNRHSRRGHFMMAISAVDNALWDLRGRYFGAPVYRLLGGPTRGQVEAYASCLGYSLEPDKMRERACAFKEQGFRFQKWFMAYGPADGAEGLKKNVEMVRILREAVGDEVELMFDAFSGWDLNYALEWAKRVESYHPHWIEEAFHPEKIESFAALRRATSVPVASGEHFYGRWEVNDYLKAEALTFVQADPEWCGGVSELVKIATLCSLHDVHLIPHGHSLHTALHVVASQSPMTCPLVEYLVLKMESYHHFELNPPMPQRGRIALPERPGFGIQFDPARIEKQTAVTWS